MKNIQFPVILDNDFYSEQRFFVGFADTNVFIRLSKDSGEFTFARYLKTDERQLVADFLSVLNLVISIDDVGVHGLEIIRFIPTKRARWLVGDGKTNTIVGRFYDYTVAEIFMKKIANRYQIRWFFIIEQEKWEMVLG